MGDEVEQKSWRNCELVLYPEQMGKMHEVLNSGWVKKWAWILHDKDEGRDPHVHLMCSWGNSATKTSVIVNKFGCRANQIETIKGTWADALDYLTHGNAEDKYQYDKGEVHANFDWGEEAKKSKSNVRKRIGDVIQKIGTGEVRQYNITSYISVEDYVSHRRKIDNAFTWRNGYVMAHLEELVEMKNIVWVFGETGTGKTTFAKQLSKTYHFMYALTSCGKNMFDEYKDEPCLIMDDLRPSDMRFSDLLGILDPYNFKAAQARYANKALQTQMIVVTTTYTPERFCRECNGGDLNAEDERQLYRRINNVYETTQQEMIEYEYNEDCTAREITNRWPNFWLMKAKKKAKKQGTSAAVSKMAEALMAEL